MINILKGLKIERNGQADSIIQRSQVLGYRVLGVLLLLDYFYKYFVHKELSQDIILVYVISVAISLKYQASNKIFPPKWNDTVSAITVAGFVLFAIILIVFFYQYK